MSRSVIDGNVKRMNQKEGIQESERMLPQSLGPRSTRLSCSTEPHHCSSEAVVWVVVGFLRSYAQPCAQIRHVHFETML
jgi:hypothetical protein